MTVIVWKDNATLYNVMGGDENITFDLTVNINPYTGNWIWHTAVKYRNSDHMNFYDFGEEETLAKAKAKSEEALARWKER